MCCQYLYEFAFCTNFTLQNNAQSFPLPFEIKLEIVYHTLWKHCREDSGKGVSQT